MATDEGFEPVRGWLFKDHHVLLHPDVMEFGGSFQARVQREDAHRPEPLAWDNGLVGFFHERLCEYERDHPDPYLFVDAGASQGSFALLAAYHPRMLVYAYEPHPRAHRLLRAHVALNGLTGRVGAFDWALGEESKRVRLQVPREARWLAVSTTARRETVRERGLEWTSFPVTQMRLDQVGLAFRVRFLKVDVEGAELMVLRGARGILERDRPRLLVEFQELNTRQFGYEPQEILALLKEVGYTKFRHVGVEDLWCEA